MLNRGVLMNMFRFRWGFAGVSLAFRWGFVGVSFRFFSLAFRFVSQNTISHIDIASTLSPNILKAVISISYDIILELVPVVRSE